MQEPEQPPDEETRAREDASISLLSSLGGMVLGTVLTANTIRLTQYGWNLEGPSIVVSGLYAAAATLFAAREWVRFHRWRDEQLDN